MCVFKISDVQIPLNINIFLFVYCLMFTISRKKKMFVYPADVRVNN